MSRARPDAIPPDLTNGNLPVARSLLSSEALRIAVQRAYPLGPVQQCVLLRSLTNDVYDVSTAQGRYILKVYGHGQRSTGEIAWEVELLAHLDGQGLAVAPAIPRADGRSIGVLRAPEGARHAVLFAFAGGAKPAAPSSDLYHNLGHVVAQLHRAADGFTTRQPRRPLDLPHLLDRSLAVVLPRLVQRPEDHAFVTRLAAAARVSLTTLASRGLDWGACHGDVSLDNVHIAPDRRIVIYDFDMAGPGWRSCDPYGVMMWVMRGQPTLWDAFLRGYQEVRPLTGTDREALPWFVPIRLLDNMRFHLSDWLRLRGALALGEDYLDGELATLRRWDRDVLGSSAAG
jgi:Ser/Thr protein kinase RdoA (MazF antagonist)